MAYNSAIPQPTNLLSQSQADILNNFTAIATVIDPNNGTLTLSQATAPTPSATQMSLFIDASNQLHFKTSAADVNVSTAGKVAAGWSNLPSGIQLIWGTGTISASAASATVTFANGGFTTGCLNVTLSPITGSSGTSHELDYILYASPTNYTKTTFVASRNSSHEHDAVSFSFLAIGY